MARFCMKSGTNPNLNQMNCCTTDESVPGHQSCEAVLVDIPVDDELEVQVAPETPCPRGRVREYNFLETRPVTASTLGPK